MNPRILAAALIMLMLVGFSVLGFFGLNAVLIVDALQ